MKKLHRLLYIVLIVLTVSVIAMFVAACSEDKTPEPPKQYTITFKLDENTDYDSYTGIAGSDITMPNKPTDATLRFEGWSTSPNGAVEEVPAKMPAEDKTYYAVFARYYSVSLSAGIGTLSGTDRLESKANQNIYAMVKDINPTAPDDSAFDGWYYDNVKLDDQSSAVMPEKNIVLEAKYSVGYTVNLHVQKKFGADETDDNKVDGNGIVGNTLSASEFSVADGCELDEEKSGGGFVISSKLADNAFDLYYNKIGYNISFVSNAPQENLTVSGDVADQEWGHGDVNVLPECAYTISGYRFSCWSTDAEGKTKLYAGDEYSIEATTMLYAVWVQGCVDASGVSSDRVYIDKTKDGKDVAYLKRAYGDEIVGEYDEKTGIIVFKNEKGATALSGRVYLDAKRFVYFRDKYILSSVGTAEHIVNKFNPDITLEIASSGNAAVYKDGSTTISGTYDYDTDGSGLKFDSKDKTFYFRLSQAIDEKGLAVNVFEIRGKEYGLWSSMDSNSKVDATYNLFLDGYGGAQMIAVGYNSTYTSTSASATAGLYGYTSNSTEEKREIAVGFGNISASNSYTFNCLLLEGDYGDEKNPINKVYVEKSNISVVYAKPVGDEALDTESADKIVLDGYGIYENSATLTEGGKTKQGRYNFDANTRQLRFMPSNDSETTYELSNFVIGENRTVVVYAETDTGFYGDFAVSGLESGFVAGEHYKFHVYNDGKAEMKLWVPYQNRYFGNTFFDFMTVAEGECKLLESGEYHFVGNLDSDLVSSAYIYYYFIFQRGIDISKFGNFKFRVDGKAKGTATGFGDSFYGYKITHNGIEYTTDGFGNAVAEDIKNNKTYTGGVSGGVTYLYLKWAEINDKDKVVEKSQLYVKIDDEFIMSTKTYYINNTNTSGVYLYVIGGDYAVLAYSSQSGVIFYEIGTIDWEDAAHKYGIYKSDRLTNANGEALHIYFGESFKFAVNIAENASSGFMYMYDCNAVFTNGKSVISGENGSQLVIDREKYEAEYKTSDGKSVKSEFLYYNDFITINEKNDDESVTKYTFKFVYNADNTAIESFVQVGEYSGTWKNYDGSKSYMVLSGELDSKTKAYKGKLVTIDEQGEQSEIVGTYVRSDSTRYIEFKFTYNIGEKAEEMYFAVGYSNGPIFVVRTEKLNNWYVYNSFANAENELAIGLLSGGEYNEQRYITGSNSRVSGKVTELVNETELYKDYKLYNFTSSDGATSFNFVLDKDNKAFMLDSTYMLGNQGKFVCTNDLTVELPETEDAAAKKITVTSIVFNGLGNAELTASDGSKYDVLYGAYTSNTFQLVAVNKNNEYIRLAFLRLYMNVAASSYTIVAQDRDVSNYFYGDGLSMLLTDGFSTAYYIDGDGRTYYGVYSRLTDNPEVIELTYTEYFGRVVRRLYFEVDVENKTLKLIANNDPRIPVENSSAD